MNVIEIDNGLNGFLGDLIGGIFQPQNNTQSEQLANELYLKNQELKKAKSTTTYAMIATGILGIATAFLGYKQLKK